VIDARGIIRKLIDPIDNSVYAENSCDIFGGGLTDAIPYAYRGKRYDPETSLLYFGKRFYDPVWHRWLTPDPLGPLDHTNLYQYAYNNPLQYSDPTGGSFWKYMLGIGEMAAGGALMIAGGIIEVGSFGTLTVGFTLAETTGVALIADGWARATIESRDIKLPQWNTHRKNPISRPENSNKPAAPPYRGDELGTDPANPAVEGFEWKGDGPPGSKEGSWYNPTLGESLHPDLDHPKPLKPHWDYDGPNGEKARLNTDGTWEWKR
jgi:RHS repeat-associated protein